MSDLVDIQSTCKSTTKRTNKVQGNAQRVRDDIGLQPGMEVQRKTRKKKSHQTLNNKQQKLVEEHLWVAGRLAYSAICRTGNQTGCFTYDDLKSVGHFALCVAATRYDESLKVKFSTFAWTTVSGYIQHALRDHSRMVRPNRRYLGLRQRVRDLLTAGNSFEEAAKTLGITVEDVLNCELSWKEIYLSIDHHNEEENRSPMEIAYDEEEDEILLRSKMIELIHNVSDCDLDLLERYYEGKTMKQSDMERAAVLIEMIKEMMDGPSDN